MSDFQKIINFLHEPGGLGDEDKLTRDERRAGPRARESQPRVMMMVVVVDGAVVEFIHVQGKECFPSGSKMGGEKRGECVCC